MHQGRCRACGAAVNFIMTPAGKWMITNTAQLSSADVKLGSRLVLEDGSVVTVSSKPREGYEQHGYIPHWATCSEPERFRKKRA